MKNPFKIISFLSLAALLLVSFVTFDTSESVEAVTPAADKVLFLDDSGNKITYYKPGDTAYFYINDVDLEQTKTGQAMWDAVTLAVADTGSWSIGSTVEVAATTDLLKCYKHSVRGGFGVAGGGVAYLAHIGGFVLGLAIGFLYKKSHRSDYTYGTRYGYADDNRDDWR